MAVKNLKQNDSHRVNPYVIDYTQFKEKKRIEEIRSLVQQIIIHQDKAAVIITELDRLTARLDTLVLDKDAQ